MEYVKIAVGALETNCYLVYCSETLECAVVDPGAEGEKIKKTIGENNLRPVSVLNTHGHVDHVGANKDIIEFYDIPLYIHSADKVMLDCVSRTDLSLLLGAKDSPPPDFLLEDGNEVKIGRSVLKVIHTPGHSEGSVSFLAETFLISGDTLFCGGVGRTDLPGGSWQKLMDSIKSKILVLPGDLPVLPGHGPITTVEREKTENPYIG
ncbi:MAG: MBL fold metallo-hydrolase [Candidatus Aminicenantes bacterium]|nr:MBL fold metallo-hydrolase [Candidatus Aminicenantes bacterium]